MRLFSAYSIIKSILTRKNIANVHLTMEQKTRGREYTTIDKNRSWSWTQSNKHFNKKIRVRLLPLYQFSLFYNLKVE